MKIKKLFNNKKAEIEEIVKTILWIVFFVMLTIGVYYLIKNLIA